MAQISLSTQAEGGRGGGGGVLEGCSLAVGGEEWGRGQRLGWAGLGFERGLWGNTLTRS